MLYEWRKRQGQSHKLMECPSFYGLVIMVKIPCTCKYGNDVVVKWILQRSSPIEICFAKIKGTFSSFQQGSRGQKQSGNTLWALDDHTQRINRMKRTARVLNPQQQVNNIHDQPFRLCSGHGGLVYSPKSASENNDLVAMIQPHLQTCTDPTASRWWWWWWWWWLPSFSFFFTK